MKQVVELSWDILEDGRRRFETCDACNYDTHTCGGCGAELSHNGLDHINGKWVEHPDCI